MSRQEPLALASVGALTCETRHEVQNVLTVVGAWTAFIDEGDVNSLKPLLAKGAKAITRLARLERALAMATATEGRGLRLLVADALVAAESLVHPRARHADVAVEFAAAPDAHGRGQRREHELERRPPLSQRQ